MIRSLRPFPWRMPWVAPAGAGAGAASIARSQAPVGKSPRDWRQASDERAPAGWLTARYGARGISDHILDTEPWDRRGQLMKHVLDVTAELPRAGVIGGKERVGS